MLIWTTDKFVRPAHAVSVYEHFYFLPGFGGTIIYVIGVAELLLLVGFVIGFASRVTYGLVFLLHAGSTFSSFRQYLHPFERIEHFVLCRLADARRLFYSLLSARSRHALERAWQKKLIQISARNRRGA
jgi:hypothetical protein